MNIVITILVTVLIFGVIIFIHELGHFLVAKACKVQVNEFAMGMGPRILKKQGKNTLYSLRAFPIGGFVSMEGEDEESENENSFSRKPVWQRLLVIFTGPVMNLLLGFILSIVMVLTADATGTTIVSGFPVERESNDIASSHMSGLEVGDKIVSINGNPTFVDNDIVYALLRAEDGYTDMTVIRDGEKIDLTGIQFDVIDTESGTQIDIDFTVLPVQKNFFSVIESAFNETISLVRTIWVSLGDIVTGNYSINDLSGPIGAGQAVGQAIGLGFSTVIYLAAFISVNVGIFNFIPFPALDGWRIVVLVVEGIRRKPMSQKIEAGINFVGFALLMVLMVYVTFSDVTKLFGG